MSVSRKGKPAEPQTETYWQAVRRPVYALIFLLPMMVLYETGVVLWGHEAAREALRNANIRYEGQVLRNGADALIRKLLGHLGDELGWGGLFVSGGVIIITLIVWQVASRQSWSLRFDHLVGMFSESVLYASLLPLTYCLASLQPFRAAMGAGRQYCMDLTFDLGSGVYEEFIFRLVLVSCLVVLLKRVFRVETGPAKFTAVVLAALVFASAHHLGSLGETFDWMTFTLRAIVGLFFGAIFVARGFGVAAGTHVFYNIVLRVLILNGPA